MKNQVDFCLAFCPTMESRQMLLAHLPDSCVYDRLIISKIEDLISLAGKYVNEKKVRRFLLVLDDVLYDKAAFRTKAIRELFYNGRHYLINCIILSQFIMDIEPSLRSNVDYCICFKDNMLSNKLRLYKYMFGLLSSLEDFISVMDRCTQNYECLILDNTSSTSGISESLFWYKARMDLPSFQVGSPIFFKLADKMRRPPGSEVPQLLENVDSSSTNKKARLLVIKEDDADGEEDKDGR